MQGVRSADELSFAQSYQESLRETLATVDMSRVAEAIRWFEETRDAGGTIFVCGNGGSASSASHFACDIVKGASYSKRSRFRIQALTDSLPTITAYSNDVGYSSVFVEQLRNFARKGDLVMCLSGSGKSPNVVEAARYGRSIGFDGGELARQVDLNIHADSPHMGRIEDAHMIVCHTIAYYFIER
jgi:D-sedoheptulose 7-phosphate isomerase